MNPSDLITVLRVNGRQPAAALASLLAISRPTLSRAVRAAGSEVLARGRARRAAYAARRALRGSRAPVPLFRVDAAGQPHEIARLHLTHPDGCALDFTGPFGWPLDDGMRDGWFDGLPWPMQDMRPQGFLGRHFARNHAALLQVSEDPNAWSDDDVLHALTLFGMDAPGDLIAGDAALRLWLAQLQKARTGLLAPGLADGDVAWAYPELAEQALALGVEGSSAGGEFPKFTVMRQPAGASPQHVLVKFSGSDASPGTRRWADLLMCEHLAGLALQEALGIEAACSRILNHGARTFLEVDRFDRHGAMGRSGVVSWSTLNSTFLGKAGRPWFEGARFLAQRGWLPQADADRIERIWYFGQLISNTDMHDGNLAFQPADGGARLRVAPVYDMLPMAYAPVRGVELQQRDYQPALPLPGEAAAWEPAARAALRFWQMAADDSRISAAFRKLCAANAARLAKLLPG